MRLAADARGRGARADARHHRIAARRRAIARVCQEVASYLGNTPAVARASYIDPRVISLYQEGRTIAASLAVLRKENEFGDLATAGHAERAVLRLLATAHAPEE